MEYAYSVQRLVVAPSLVSLRTLNPKCRVGVLTLSNLGRVE